MPYTDAQFQVRHQIPLPALVGGTQTASATNGLNLSFTGKKFKRANRISAVRVQCTTAPAQNNTGTTLIFLNGTNTVASLASLGTFTANQFGDATLTANTDFAQDGTLTISLIGTATQSGQSSGTYAVEIEQTEIWS